MTHKKTCFVLGNVDLGQCLAELGELVQLLFYKRVVSQTQVGEADAFSGKPEKQEHVFPQQKIVMLLDHTAEATGPELMTAVKHSRERFCGA